MTEQPEGKEDPGAGIRSSDDGAASSTGTVAVVDVGLVYRAVWLVFLLALVLIHFDAIARVLLLAFLSAIIAVAIDKVVKRIPLKRSIAAPIVALLFLVGFGTVIYFLGSEVARQLSLLIQQLPELWENVNRWEATLRDETGFEMTVISERAMELVRDLPNVLRQALGLLEIVALVLLVMIGAFFAAAEPNQRLLSPAMRAIPREQRRAWYHFLHLLGERLGGWIWGSLISMVIIGTITTAALYFMRAPYSLLLGVTVGVLEIVPMVGPWIGGIIAVVVTLLHDPGLALWVALVLLAIQQIEGNVVYPMIMRGAVAVHPFVSLLALILFSAMFGLLGAILALPLVLALQTATHVFWIEAQLGTQDDDIEPVVSDDR